MFEFFQKLFDPSGFPRRWNCGTWTEGLGWLHILSDLATWGAYTAIPIVLAYFVLRRKDAPFPKIFILFACFIFACGTVHLIEATIFWWPIYRFSGAVKLATAIVSWATVVALIPVTPKALALPGLAKVNEQLQHEVKERQTAEYALRDSEASLRAVVDSAGEGILTVDEARRVVTFNAAAERIFGYSAHEVLGRSIADLIPRFHALVESTRLGGNGRDAIAAHSEHTNGHRKGGTQFPLEVTVAETRVKGRPVVICIARDITERKRLEEQQNLLMAELSHRVKNTLATVQSIAMQTMRFTDSKEDFQASFEGRLQALAQAHNLLTACKWEGIGLREIVSRELEPHGGANGGRVSIRGPDVTLRPKAAIAMQLALHELTTNAAKYGALSTDFGRVDVAWGITDGAKDVLHLTWIESNGPPVQPSVRQGFGSRLIQAAIEYELDGQVKLDYSAAGLRGEFRLPWSDPAIADDHARFAPGAQSL